mmetsp:Transcript_11912/g.26649  ORF Transcript_11912/g.26649 Transcript_11912/m.26649 type:complete len:84 (-) Transcript_11912:976-1227(-)
MIGWLWLNPCLKQTDWYTSHTSGSAGRLKIDFLSRISTSRSISFEARRQEKTNSAVLSFEKGSSKRQYDSQCTIRPLNLQKPR